MQGEDDNLLADLREAFDGVGGSEGQAGFGRPGSLPELPDRAEDFHPKGDSALPPGSRLGDFEIVGELGRGGMGIVYRARQISLGRQVALKVLPGYATRGQIGVKRFLTEAQAAARLNHTNIVSVYAQGEHEGQFYYAMELVDGVGLDVVVRVKPEILSSAWFSRVGPREASSAVLSSLRQTIVEADAARGETGQDGAPGSDRKGPVAVEVTSITRTGEDYRHLARLMASVADGLHHAHQQGVIHRDIKPHNLLLGVDNCLHIADFGLARLTDEPHLTVPGEVMGTPSYLSPEQIRGDMGRVDHRTDVYSLGVTLYEVITGRPPFVGETREQIIHAICHDEPRSPRRVDKRIPVDLETICLRAIEKEPARRHPTAGVLADDLRRFADGRPILSRRTGYLEKAGKWMKRHKAQTAAMIAIAATVLLSGGWSLTLASSRRSEINRLLGRAYERLVFLDYRDASLVADDIRRAERLGAADSSRTDIRRTYQLLRALEEVVAHENQAAIELLEGILESDPDDALALYALAWVHVRNRDRPSSFDVFDRAESLGGAETAEEWFFRGLSRHFDRPTLAVKSYQRANAIRAGDHGFYPQAILHLARARNQQMYRTRAIDTFSEARAGLEQLIEHGHYGAYPYYLLSIAHRLAAEIYDGSTGTRAGDGPGSGRTLVQEHFDLALEWARKGQQIDPDADRPVTAEAECLESMGLFEQAIEARTKAIELASTYYKQCEGHHFRWRLCYWADRLDEAVDDLGYHADCDPDSLLYSNVYPALVHAELGNMERALALARGLVEGATGEVDPMRVLWSATTLRLLGREEEAAELLTDRQEDVDFSAGLVAPQSEEWLRALYAYCAGDEIGIDDLLAMTDEVPMPWKLRGEAHFHAGAISLASGDRRETFNQFLAAYRSFDSEEKYTFCGKMVYVKLRQDPGWPAWIPVEIDANDAGRPSLPSFIDDSLADRRSGGDAASSDGED